jgi:hypothetical protein
VISDLADVFPNGNIKSVVFVDCDEFGFTEGLQVPVRELCQSNWPSIINHLSPEPPTEASPQTSDRYSSRHQGERVL